MSLKNAKTLPRVYYGLHFAPGVAEYREEGQEPYRILINENTIKEMDPTFAGRPVYVHHVDSVDVDKIQTEADGYVSESFFNSLDGKHWVKFIIVSDRGHEAIAQGWKLSNAYIPKEFTGGGLWHGVEYLKEVKRGEYEHLAVVPNPRYEESIILTPDEFKTYNSNKESELKRLKNSKTGERSMSIFSFFKKEKVSNSADLDQMSVVLPKSGKEKALTQLINEADEAEQKKDAPQMANGDHKVKVGEEEMTVNELVEKHLALKDSLKKDEEEKAAPSEEPKKNEEEEKQALEPKKNEEASEDETKKNEEEKKEEAKKNAIFEALKNAPSKALLDTPRVELSADKVSRGKSRYGSGN